MENSMDFSVKFNPFSQCFHHKESIHLICTSNQLTGFYMTGTLALNELIRKKAPY